jgi:4-hydroxy-2-oxoheptanedioate aldolase
MWTPQTFGEAARGGQRLYGTLIASPSPMWPKALATAGLDFVFIDTEHIALDRVQVSWMCRAYRALGVMPLVRIPSPDPYQATMALDDGAVGLIAPYVETVDQVKRLRGAVKLRPLKGKRLQTTLEGEPLPNDLQTYIDGYCRDNLLIVQVESAAGLEALDDMLAVPGIDVIMVGPHDLSCNLGVPEEWQHPRYVESCKTIFRKARSKGVAACVHFWGTNEEQARLLNAGANLLVHASDMRLFTERLKTDLKEIRKRVGDTPPPSSSNADNLHV